MTASHSRCLQGVSLVFSSQRARDVIKYDIFYEYGNCDVNSRLIELNFKKEAKTETKGFRNTSRACTCVCFAGKNDVMLKRQCVSSSAHVNCALLTCA